MGAGVQQAQVLRDQADSRFAGGGLRIDGMPGLTADHSIPPLRRFKEKDLGDECGVPGVRAENTIHSKGKLFDL